MLVSSLLLLIPALLLLLLFWALHSLAPCLVAARLVLNHCIESHVASSSATSPLLKMTSVLLLITSLLLTLLPSMGVLLMWLTLLWLCRLLCLPLIWGGPKVARLDYFYSAVPLFVALVCALGVVTTSVLPLLLVLLGPRMPSVLAAHSLWPVVLRPLVKIGRGRKDYYGLL